MAQMLARASRTAASVVAGATAAGASSNTTAHADAVARLRPPPNAVRAPIRREALGSDEPWLLAMANDLATWTPDRRDAHVYSNVLVEPGGSGAPTRNPEIEPHADAQPSRPL